MGAGLFFFIVFGVYVWRISQVRKPVAEAPAPIQTETWIVAKQFELATIGKGEGIEHALIRQLISDPIGYKGERSPGAIKKWAQGEAHRIATSLGFIQYREGRIAKEVRVRGGGGDIAYVLLHKDGRWTVEKYSKAKSEFRVKPDFIASVQEIGKAQFCADIPCLQAYEYVYRKIKGKEKHNNEKALNSTRAVAHGIDHGGNSRYGRADKLQDRHKGA